MEYSQNQLEQIVGSLDICIGSEYIGSADGFIGMMYVLRDVLSGKYPEEVKQLLIAKLLERYNKRLEGRDQLRDFEYNTVFYFGASAYIRRLMDMMYSSNNVKELVNYLKSVDEIGLNDYVPSEYIYDIKDEDIMMCFDLISSGLACFNSGVINKANIHVNVLDAYNKKVEYNVDVYDVDGGTHVAITLYKFKDRRLAIRRTVESICKFIAYFMLTYEHEEAFKKEMEGMFKGYRDKGMEFQAESLKAVLTAVAIKRSSNENIKAGIMTNKDKVILSRGVEDYIVNMCYNM